MDTARGTIQCEKKTTIYMIKEVLNRVVKKVVRDGCTAIILKLFSTTESTAMFMLMLTEIFSHATVENSES